MPPHVRSWAHLSHLFMFHVVNIHEVLLAFAFAQAFCTPAHPSLCGFLTGAGAVFKFLRDFPRALSFVGAPPFQELQTFVSVVASARSYRGMPVRRRCFTEAAVLAASSEKLKISFSMR